MMLVAIALAFACDPNAAVQTLKSTADKDAYVCVYQVDIAREPLVAALIVDPTNERLTRALALWLLHRTEDPFDADLVRRLNASDRRLLADGVRAHRGRRTPVPAHEKVFAQLLWYAPRDSYTDTQLSALDRENIAMADKPPPAPVVDEPLPPAPRHGCNCGGNALFFLPFSFLRWRMRRAIRVANRPSRRAR